MDTFCIVLFFITNELTALSMIVSFEACCQWALLRVPITRLVTLPYCIETTFYPSVSKVHTGCFRVSIIHRTLIWTTGFLACIHDHSCAWYIHTGVAGVYILGGICRTHVLNHTKLIGHNYILFTAKHTTFSYTNNSEVTKNTKMYSSVV